jgi:hypothetical protein
MNRRMIPFSIAAALTATMASAQSGDPMMSVLKASMEGKKGVTLHVRGQSIAMIVTSINDNYVEGRNQQSSRIVVRMSSIDAAIAS